MSTATEQQPWEAAVDNLYRVTWSRERMNEIIRESCAIHAANETAALRAAILPLLTEVKEMRDGLPQDCAGDLQIIAGWDALIGPVEEAMNPPRTRE